MSAANDMIAHPEAGILEAVAEKHGLSVGDLIRSCRIPAIVRARDEAAYRIRAELGYSYLAIEYIFCRDASTMRTAVRRHQERAQA